MRHPFMMSFYRSQLLKKIVVVVFLFSSFAALFNHSFRAQFGLRSIELFGLNQFFLNRFFLWQPATALFWLPAESLNLSALLDYAFALILFWVLGNRIAEKYGEKRFLKFFIGSWISALVSSLIGLYYWSPLESISLFYPILLAIAISWCMSFQTEQIPLFFFPISSRLFFLMVTIISLGMSLLDGLFVKFLAYAGALVFSYLFSLIAFGQNSPFDCLVEFEQFIKRAALKLASVWRWNIASKFRKK